MRLPSKEEDFTRGSRDTFRMQLKAVGAVTRLTVGHDNRGANPDWHLDQVELTDEEAGPQHLQLANAMSHGKGFLHSASCVHTCRNRHNDQPAPGHAGWRFALVPSMTCKLKTSEPAHAARQDQMAPKCLRIWRKAAHLQASART